MRIFELDTEDRLNSIIDNIGYVKTLKDSVADNTAQYRRFATSIALPYDVLSECCSTYERTVLIESYTYAEQLLKNFYYQLLEKDTAKNQYFQAFVNSKLKVDRFSPNATFVYMEQGIRNDLFPEFQFLLSKRLPQIAKYNELIQSRHKYAHKGEYLFDFSTMNEVVEVEYYVTAVFSMVVEKGMDYRVEYQKKFKEISSELKNVIELYKQEDGNPKVGALKSKVLEKEHFLYRAINSFYKKYHEDIYDIKLINSYITAVENLLNDGSRSHIKVKRNMQGIYNEMSILFLS